MTPITSIHQLLSIEDKNIQFVEPFTVSDVFIKGIRHKQLQGVLTYIPKACECCGCVNINHSIIKHGYKTVTILLGEIQFQPLLLKLKKQRFFCKECLHTFIASTSLVEKQCHISRLVKRKIMDFLTEEMAMSTIARHTFVSTNTVIRELLRVSQSMEKCRLFPKTICIDEFASVKSVDGKMSFIFCDGDTHHILDILENRNQQSLIDYFLRFPLETRKQVKYVVMDMFKPYINVVKTCFPNAHIIIDKFHVVQHLNRAINRIRIETMNRYRYSSPTDYRKLKQLWRLLLKNREDLDVDTFFYHRLFSGLMTEKMMVEYMIQLSPPLSQAYTIINDLKYDLAVKDAQQFKDDLYASKQYSLRQYVRTALRSLEYHLDSISLSLSHSYTNGALEGLNNRIKNIKRSGYGYRNFRHLRARIFIINRLFYKKKREDSSSLPSLSYVA